MPRGKVTGQDLLTALENVKTALASAQSGIQLISEVLQEHLKTNPIAEEVSIDKDCNPQVCGRIC